MLGGGRYERTIALVVLFSSLLSHTKKKSGASPDNKLPNGIMMFSAWFSHPQKLTGISIYQSNVRI